MTALRRLRELDLRANRLADDALDQLDSASLRVLDVSANNVTRLRAGSLHGLPALRDLRVDDGRLALVESGALLRSVHLETFSARRNRLRRLPDDLFRTTRRLRVVRLDANQLSALPVAVADVVSLRQLSLADNRIGDTLDACATLHSLRNLVSLNVSRNAIVALASLERCNLTRLVHLDLSANLLTALPDDAFGNAVSLRTVDLSANRFARLPIALAHHSSLLPPLERLVVDNNPIRRIGGAEHQHDDDDDWSVAGYAGAAAAATSPPIVTRRAFRLPLRELVVCGCANLSAVGGADLDPFDQLVDLRLTRNAIARILPGAFRSLANLMTLDLGDNRVDSLPAQRLRGLRRLKVLNLTRNALRSLDPFGDHLPALETLDVSYNRLTSVDGRAFRLLANLTELRLRGNRIATVAADAFRPLANLRTLDVAGNELRSLPLDAFKPLETRLRSLVIRGKFKFGAPIKRSRRDATRRDRSSGLSSRAASIGGTYLKITIKRRD